MTVPPSNVPPSTPPPSGGVPSQPPPQPQQPGGDSDRTLMLVLSYVFFLGLIPLIVRKEDRDIQWHAKNGLLLFAAYLIIQVALSILGWILGDTCLGGAALGILSCLAFVGYIVLMIIGIMKAVKGDRLRIPGISEMADKM